MQQTSIQRVVSWILKMIQRSLRWLSRTQTQYFFVCLLKKFRSVLLIYSSAQPPRTGGHPSKTRPLQPGHSLKGKKSQHRDHSPEPFCNVRFSKSWGPAGLLHNSLLINQSTQQDQIRSLQKRKLKTSPAASKVSLDNISIQC
jgi:hypothetical protein